MRSVGLSPRFSAIGLALVFCAGCGTVQPGAPGSGARSDLALEQKNARFAEALANYAQGLILDEHNLHDKAVAHYEQAARLDPERTALPIGIAMDHLHRNQHDAAIAALEEAHRAQPQAYDILLTLALVYSAADRTDEAFALYQEGLRIAPDQFETYLQLADIYREREDDTKFHAILNAGLRRAKDPVPILRALADYHVRQALAASDEQTRAQHYDKAIDAYEEAARKTPDNTAVNFRLGKLFVTLGRYREAMDCFRRISEEEPGFFFIKALAHQTEDDPAASLHPLEQAVELFPTDFMLLMTLGELYEDLKKPDQAEPCYRKAREIAPDRTAPYLRLSMLYAGREQEDKALAVIEAGLTQKPDNILFRMHKGYFKSRLKQYQDAILIFERAEDLLNSAPPSKVDKLKPTFYFWFGACCERDDQHTRAETLFRTCLELDPRHDEAYNYLAYMWAERTENLDEALTFAKKALAIQPANGAYVDTLGWIYYQRKEYEKAATELARAHDLMKDDPTVNDHLGDVILILKGSAEALPYWEQSLALDPENAAVQEKIDTYRMPVDPAAPIKTTENKESADAPPEESECPASTLPKQP